MDGCPVPIPTNLHSAGGKEVKSNSRQGKIKHFPSPICSLLSQLLFLTKGHGCTCLCHCLYPLRNLKAIIHVSLALVRDWICMKLSFFKKQNISLFCQAEITWTNDSLFQNHIRTVLSAVISPCNHNLWTLWTSWVEITWLSLNW